MISLCELSSMSLASRCNCLILQIAVDPCSAGLALSKNSAVRIIVTKGFSLKGEGLRPSSVLELCFSGLRTCRCVSDICLLCLYVSLFYVTTVLSH